MKNKIIYIFMVIILIGAIAFAIFDLWNKEDVQEEPETVQKVEMETGANRQEEISGGKKEDRKSIRDNMDYGD